MALWNKTPQKQFGKTVHGPAYRGPAGMPMFDQSHVSRGAKGGAVIWGMEEAFVPPENVGGEDLDGFAVFGQFPAGFLAHVVKLRLLGDIRRDDILHVCSGTLSEHERWTVDLRLQAKPLVVASGTALPFADSSFRAVVIDPPYSDEYAHNLYGVKNPRPSHLLKEAARVLRPSGRIGLLHVAIPFPPPECEWLRTYGVTTGLGYRIRAFTVFQKRQAALFDQ